MHLSTAFVIGLFLPGMLLSGEPGTNQELKQALERPTAHEAPLEVAVSKLKVKYRPAQSIYPPLAKLIGVQGTVILNLTIGTKGLVEKVEVLDGPALLRPTAEALIRAWGFEPITHDGVPIRVQSKIAIPFQLNASSLAELKQPIDKAVIEVESLPSIRAVSLDLGQVRQTIDTWLTSAGFHLELSQDVEASDTLFMKVQIQTIHERDGTCVFNLMGRCSRLSDRTLQENEPGKPQRIIFFNRVVGQKREAGFQEAIQKSLRAELQTLLVWPIQSAPKEELDLLAQTLGITLRQGNPVDFDFSQIKIKRQPPAPPYPPLAKSCGISGTVVVEITIDPTGNPAWAEVKSGPPELLMTAITYALRWEFEPARLNGTPQWARFKLTMPFNLRDNPFPGENRRSK